MGNRLRAGAEPPPLPLMGGEISAVSEPGIGATFTIKLPAIIGGDDAEVEVRAAVAEEDFQSVPIAGGTTGG